MKRAYKANDRFMYRIPTAPMENIDANEQELLNKSKDKAFREKILVASPDLLHMIDQYIIEDNDLSDKKKRELFQSLKKYYIRSVSRTTPFGLFTAVGTGNFGEENTFLNENQTFRKKVYLDSKWMNDYLYEKEKENFTILKLQMNRACNTDGNREVLLYSTSEDESEVSMRNTRVFEIVRHVAESMTEYSNIVDEIKQEYIDIPEEKIKAYISELVNKQVLISDLKPSGACENQIVWIIDKFLEYNIPDAGKLESLKEMIDKYEKTSIGDGQNIYNEIVKKMKEIHKSKHYLQVDSFIENSKFTLSDEVKRKIEMLASFLTSFKKEEQVTYQIFEEYRNRFIEKYGYLREVPILEMMDAEKGISCPKGYTKPEDETQDNTVAYQINDMNLRNYFVSKYEDAIENHTDIELSEEELSKILKNENQDLNTEVQNSLEMYFTLKEKDNDILLYLSSNGGADRAGKTFGRFSTGSNEIESILNEIIDNEKNILSDETYTCEVQMIPSDTRNANVVRGILKRDYTLSLFTIAENNEIKLEDILIGTTDSSFYARDRKSGKIVNFSCTNMFNVSLLPNPIRFLVEMTNDGKSIWYDFPWRKVYQYQRHIPKIIFDGIVLQNEQWMLNGADLSVVNEVPDFDNFVKGVKEFAKKHNMPETFKISNDDNQLILNLNDRLGLEILHNEVKKKSGSSVLLERIEYGEEYNPNHQKEYVTQIVVPLTRIKKEEKIIPNMVKPVTRNEHMLLPFNKCIFFKLYCSKQREEELIALELEPFGKEIKEKYGVEHFFMRYKDPKNHLRVRFFGNEVTLLQAVPDIMQWMEALERKGIIGEITINQYEREVERYGGINLMPHVEALFMKDSQIVERLIQLVRMKKTHMNMEDITLISVARFLESFYDSFEHRYNFLTSCFHTNKYMESFRFKRAEYLRDFDMENGWVGFNSDEARRNIMSIIDELEPLIVTIKEKMVEEEIPEWYVVNIIQSILHLHCNRMLGTNRELENKIMAFTESFFHAKKHLYRRKVVND